MIPSCFLCQNLDGLLIGLKLYLLIPRGPCVFIKCLFLMISPRRLDMTLLLACSKEFQAMIPSMCWSGSTLWGWEQVRTAFKAILFLYPFQIWALNFSCSEILDFHVLSRKSKPLFAFCSWVLTPQSLGKMICCYAFPWIIRNRFYKLRVGVGGREKKNDPRNLWNITMLFTWG